MSVEPAELLKHAEGSLGQTPLPRLFHALCIESRSCTLVLKVQGLEKRISFADGSPVACTSNLLHETIGKFLVTKGKLTDKQVHDALAEAASSAKPVAEVIVARQWIAPFELHKLLQANLAWKILEAFRWSDAQYRILVPAGEVAQPLRMNAVQLVLSGVASYLPIEVVAANLIFQETQRFMLAPQPSPALGEIKFSTREAKLLRVLKGNPVFSEILARTGFERNDGLRRLYAFVVLGLIELEPPAPPPPPVPPPAAVPVSPPAPTAAPVPDPPVRAEIRPEPSLSAAPWATPLAAQERDLREALTRVFAGHRSKDPFDLLDVPETVQPAALRKAFLAAADRFAPNRLTSAESKEKAETLLIAYAQAYAELADESRRKACQQRRAAGRARPEEKKPAADLFHIKTPLLSADQMFVQGKQKLEANNPRGAFEYFAHACELDPTPACRAHLAWSRHLMNSGRNPAVALSELSDVVKADPKCEEAFFFLGEIYRAQSHVDAAVESYRRAHQLRPDNRYSELIRDLQRNGRK